MDQDEAAGGIPFYDTLPAFQLDSTISLDMLEDWIVTLTHENLKRMQECGPLDGSFLDNRSVEFLCVLCEKLGVAANVKYAAAALFDSFMLRHVRFLREQLAKSKSKTKDKDWQRIEDKISSQVTLRLFSCVQIASKMEHQSKCVHTCEFNRLLRGMGLCHPAEHILKSEIRVMKTLDYKINVASPLVFIETLLKILHLHYANLPVDAWYNWCLLVLDAIYLFRDEIYEETVKGILGGEMQIDRQRMVMIQSDYLLLGTSVITTAAYVTSGRDIAQQVATVLQSMTGISFTDMTHFCAAVVEKAMTPLDDEEESDDDEEFGDDNGPSTSSR